MVKPAIGLALVTIVSSVAPALRAGNVNPVRAMHGN